MTKCEFWCWLRELERKYDKKTRSPVRRRLVWIDGWASSVMDGWPATEGVPRWLYNELKHVEEGRDIGLSGDGKSLGRPPAYADLLFHGVLNDEPWWKGNTVLPSSFVMRKRSHRKALCKTIGPGEEVRL